MDDPDIQWPAWKFGMKRDDLFTKLHIQYNTISSPLQDPEAFHHDVFEIANEASTTDEFHRLLAVRKEQRLRELDSVFESASLEIISNPSLIGTAQWHLAVQLFRTKSFDALVRYFTSYIPSHHPWHHRPNKQSKVASHNIPDHEFPPSPTSMTAYSDASATSRSDYDHHDYIRDNYSPTRTLSFSGSEPDDYGFAGSCPPLHDDSNSQSSGAVSSVSSIIDPAETHQKDMFAEPLHIQADDAVVLVSRSACDEHAASAGHVTEDAEADSPTPKPKREAHASSFFDTKPSPLSSTFRHRSLSPSRAFPLVHTTLVDCRRTNASPRFSRREPSPIGRRERKERRRRLPEGIATADLHISVPNLTRCGPRGRRRVVEERRIVESWSDDEGGHGC